MRCRHAVWLGVLLLAVAVRGVRAQYQPGDLILAPLGKAASGEIVRITPGGKASTFLAVPSGRTYGGIVCSPDNRSLWTSAHGGGLVSGLHDIDAHGVHSTIFAGVYGIPFALDDDGAPLVGNFFGVFSIHVGQGFATIIAPPSTSSIWSRGWGLDIETGDIVITRFDISGTSTTNTILRVARGGPPVVTTLVQAAAVGLDSEMVFDPRDGSLCGLHQNSVLLRLQLRPVARMTTIRDYRSQGDARDTICLPGTGSAFVLKAGGGWTIGYYASVDKVDLATGKETRIATTRASRLQAYLAMVGGRHLSPRAAPIRGRAYPILVSFPREPGAAYLMGASFGLRPGIKVPGSRKIYLRPDGLLAYSLTDSGIFSGFHGRLDAGGEATARILLPNLPQLAGRRFFLCALTYDSTGVRSISEPIGATIR